MPSREVTATRAKLADTVTTPALARHVPLVLAMHSNAGTAKEASLADTATRPLPLLMNKKLQSRGMIIFLPFLTSKPNISKFKNIYVPLLHCDFL